MNDIKTEDLEKLTRDIFGLFLEYGLNQLEIFFVLQGWLLAAAEKLEENQIKIG